MTTASIVQRDWNYCYTFIDDGVGYGDYLEELTCILFLEMADEYSNYKPFLVLFKVINVRNISNYL